MPVPRKKWKYETSPKFFALDSGTYLEICSSADFLARQPSQIALYPWQKQRIADSPPSATTVEHVRSAWPCAHLFNLAEAALATKCVVEWVEGRKRGRVEPYHCLASSEMYPDPGHLNLPPRAADFPAMLSYFMPSGDVAWKRWPYPLRQQQQTYPLSLHCGGQAWTFREERGDFVVELLVEHAFHIDTLLIAAQFMLVLSDSENEGDYQVHTTFATFTERERSARLRIPKGKESKIPQNLTVYVRVVEASAPVPIPAPASGVDVEQHEPGGQQVRRDKESSPLPGAILRTTDDWPRLPADTEVELLRYADKDSCVIKILSTDLKKVVPRWVIGHGMS